MSPGDKKPTLITLGGGQSGEEGVPCLSPSFLPRPVPASNTSRSLFGSDGSLNDPPFERILHADAVAEAAKSEEPLTDDEDSEEDDEFADDFATIRNANVLLHNMVHVDILKKTSWKQSSSTTIPNSSPTSSTLPGRTPIILLLKHNIPNGYADIPFPSKVLDRFPSKNYRNLPFPEEELPMFCYAKGSTLVRDQLCNIGLPKAYGFVVKNERGDSIYGKCYLCIRIDSLVGLFSHFDPIIHCNLVCSLSIMFDIYGTTNKSKEGRA